jgi:hypothetical protein
MKHCAAQVHIWPDTKDRNVLVLFLVL